MQFKKIFITIFFLFIALIVNDFIYAQNNKDSIVYNENLALGRPITVSSNAGSAQIIVNGQEAPNASWHTSWQPPQNPSRPSWFVIDLGRIQSIQKLMLVFSVAAYEGIYDIWAPPNSIVIEAGNSLDKMQAIEVIPSEKIPENGACPDKRRLEVVLKNVVNAKYVKFMFPLGGKLKIMSDVVGMGEVAIYGPELKSEQNHKKVSIEGHFGKAVIDVDAPEITDLFLREPDGKLADRSLLASTVRGVTLAESKDQKIFYRRGAYTYVADNMGHRFESRYSRSHKVIFAKDSNGKIKRITFKGIKLQSDKKAQGPVEEDWILEKNTQGMLSWKIIQRWLKPFNGDISGTPAIFLARFGGWGAYRDRRVEPIDPQITSTIWYEPSHLKSGTHPEYETFVLSTATEYRTHTIGVRNTWAIYKFFTNFHLKSDLRLAVEGGYLFRRAGVRNDFNEIGSTVDLNHTFQRQVGDISTIALVLSSVSKFETGQQLAIEIPDLALSCALQDLHASVLNGGIISDPKRYDFGNGTEDINYAGSADFQARALSVSMPLNKLSEYSYDADKAFKGHLERILATVNAEGLTCFGFNTDGQLLDDNFHVVNAVKAYVIKTGDQEFITRYYTTLEKMIDFFVTRLDKSNGLFRSSSGAHWYYDGITFSGFNTYYQTFLYQALVDLAEMAEIIGKTEDNALRLEQAKHLAANINKHLWYPDAPGGPRYADWIDELGKRADYFVDIVQYPLIAFGIAPSDRAEAILTTANKRLNQLKEQFAHTRVASLSLLWPLSATRGTCFGTYFYGGSLLASTYWEVVARARAGHIEGEWGAYPLLQNFAKRFIETSFVGSNSIDIKGNISLGGDEGYLSDMVVVPSALVHGLLGIKMNWKEITVTPAMPSEWKNAKVSLMWKGHLYDIIINNNRVNITQK